MSSSSEPRRAGRLRRAGALAALSVAPLVLLVSCLSEDRAVEKWEAWLAEHDDCATDGDCALVYPGCPLGCTDAVSAAHVEAAEREAERLVNRYERAGRSCEYECVGAEGVACESGRCQVVLGDY